MTYYLLDHPNPHHRDGSWHWYTTRQRPVLAVVLHITAGLEDQDMIGPDHSAESTARYAATTDRRVSWHRGADSDGWLQLLPDGYTAFHVRGYNSSTVGLEISKRDTTWGDEPPAWVDATIGHAADACRSWVADHGVPLRKATPAELDAAIAHYDRTGEARPVGFIYHEDLDPTRRRDPGDDFPFHQFLDHIGDEDMAITEERFVELARDAVRAELNAGTGHGKTTWAATSKETLGQAQANGNSLKTVQATQARILAALEVNLGHVVGDAALQALARAIVDGLDQDLAAAVADEIGRRLAPSS